MGSAKIEVTREDLIKRATIGLIGDGVKTISTGELYERVCDQADRVGEHKPSWPAFIDAIANLGWDYGRFTYMGRDPEAAIVTIEKNDRLIHVAKCVDALEGLDPEKLGQLLRTVGEVAYLLGYNKKVEGGSALARSLIDQIVDITGTSVRDLKERQDPA